MRKIRLLTMVLLLASTLSMVINTMPVEAAGPTHFDGLLWTRAVVGIGPVIHHTHITIPATSFSSGNVFGAGLVAVCKLRGDFDMRVSFELSVWPSGNGVRVALLATGQPVITQGTFAIRVSASATDGFAKGEYYVTFQNGGGSQGLTPTSDLSGSLREVRNGGTLTAYYLSGVNWISLGSWSVTTSDTFFAILALSADSIFAHVDVKATFRDFIINSGTLVCP